MMGTHLRDLHAFLTVAEEHSFTRAARRLGVSQSALSQTIRTLEERLDMALFLRTTRKVSLTEAGERLRRMVAPAMAEIEQGLAQMHALRNRPAGRLRISADEYAVRTVLWPILPAFMRTYPEIQMEITTDYALTDIVAQRYDAGVRRGGLIAKDMIAVRVGPDVPMAVVASPDYFARHPKPKCPQELVAHRCIQLRLPTQTYFGWIFWRKGKEQRVKVDGTLVLSTVSQVVDAALAGLGLIYVPAPLVQTHLHTGQLIEVLSDWRHTYAGYHLYYPNRRKSAALDLLIKALRAAA